MRLIDVDDLRVYAMGGRCNGKITAKTLVEESLERIFREAPTVEAIPIGYIENRIAELTILIIEHGDFIEYDEMVKVWIHEANSLERLLKKWRERK